MGQLKKHFYGYFQNGGHKKKCWIRFLKILKIMAHDHIFIIISNVAYKGFEVNILFNKTSRKKYIAIKEKHLKENNLK